MRIIRDIQFVADQDKGACAAIGNFDGVHLGHQAVIDLAREQASKTDAALGILTFEPHPREHFSPSSVPFRLMNADAKANRLEKLGVEKLYELSFNTALSELAHEEFCRIVIAEGLGLTHVVVGSDFCYGKDRLGTAATLKTSGERLGFGVTIADLLQVDLGRVSSTSIRQALSDGHPRDAAKMLGHLHRIEGAVIRGDQRGRVLGYPTANMSIEGLHPPKFGVYAVWIDVLTGPHKGSYKGAASVGVRPMFGENRPNIETFLLDFAGDLYGETLSVALVDYLRPELKFDGIETLVDQMARDVIQTRDILS